MQAQTLNGSAAEATMNTICVGDQVTYVKMTATAGGYGLSVKEAKVIAIDGSVARLRGRNGRTGTQPLQKLTPAGQRNALTRALLGDA
ncbi:hypothetical protein [Pseudomonas sp. W5-36]|uniref:hypothetical protein n=1 Tax=Pseudomonas sp. W5-36 TaxID=3097455 RepID=UPI00397B46EE